MQVSSVEPTRPRRFWNKRTLLKIFLAQTCQLKMAARSCSDCNTNRANSTHELLNNAAFFQRSQSCSPFSNPHWAAKPEVPKIHKKFKRFGELNCALGIRQAMLIFNLYGDWTTSSAEHVKRVRRVPLRRPPFPQNNDS